MRDAAAGQFQLSHGQPVAGGGGHLHGRHRLADPQPFQLQFDQAQEVSGIGRRLVEAYWNLQSRSVLQSQAAVQPQHALAALEQLVTNPFDQPPHDRLYGIPPPHRILPQVLGRCHRRLTIGDQGLGANAGKLVQPPQQLRTKPRCELVAGQRGQMSDGVDAQGIQQPYGFRDQPQGGQRQRAQFGIADGGLRMPKRRH